MARRKVKNGKKSPWGQCPYQTSSKRLPPFSLLIGARKLLCFSVQSEGRTAATFPRPHYLPLGLPGCFHIDHSAPCLPPKFCLTIIFDFSWDDCNGEEKCDGDVTMVAKFLVHNNREILQHQKAIGLDWLKNNFARASRAFFVHFLAVVARLRHETS